MTVSGEVQKLSVDGLLVLFQMDLTALGGDVAYWTNNVDVGQEVSFGGNIYVPVEMAWEGFDKETQGALPRPKISIGNVTNAGTSLLQMYRNLVGATVTRLKVFAENLDSGSDPDDTQVLQYDVFRITRKSSHTKTKIEWELRAFIDLEGVQIPLRQLTRYCPARYRRWDPINNSFIYDTSDIGCPYNGGQFFDVNDQPTTPDKDRASKRLSCCQKRFGVDGNLPFFGYPGAGRIQ